MRPLQATLLALTLVALTLALTGCGIGSLAPASPAAGAALHGGIHGGQQPVAGAHVYLFAANTTTYAGNTISPTADNASLSLLDPVSTGLSDSTGAYVLSAADGTFDITGDYTCTPGQQVYLLAYGGDSGTGSNIHIGLMAILGNCPLSGDFSSVPFVEINEVSTVAAAYAIAGYATDAFHVSTNGSPQALTGIANAFATASNLVDLGSGAALATTPAGNGTVPQATINTLANILATCVNSADLQLFFPLPSAPCISLFTPATSLGSGNGFIPYETATAAINIAHYPADSVATLYAFPVPKAPFYPILNAQPNDFSVSLAFTPTAGLNFGGQLAIDAQGNVWVPYQVSSGTNSNNGAITEFSNLGVPLSAAWTQTNINHPVSVTIDPSGNAFVANLGTGALLTEYSSAGTERGTTTDAANPSYHLLSPAFDPSGNLWVTDGSSPGSLLEYSNSGTPLQTLTSNGISGPGALAFDAAGDLWVENQQGHTIGKFSNGAAAANNPFSLADTSYLESIAVDASGHLWALKQSAAIDVLDSTGTELPGAPYNTGFGGSAMPQATYQALDGAGNDWITTSTLDFSSFPPVTTNNLVELSNTGALITPGVGIFLNVSFPPRGIAPDSAGNLWLTAGAQLLEYVGLSTPIETPISKALADQCIAQLPCAPAPPPP